MTMASTRATDILVVIAVVVVAVASAADKSGSNGDDATPDAAFSGHSLSLNNVGLDENNPEEGDLEPTLQGPNVCTKQET
jgi:hypothetical protein